MHVLPPGSLVTQSESMLHNQPLKEPDMDFCGFIRPYNQLSKACGCKHWPTTLAEIRLAARKRLHDCSGGIASTTNSWALKDTTHTHTHTQTHTHRHTRTHAPTHPPTHPRTHARTHAHTHARTVTHTHTQSKEQPSMGRESYKGDMKR